MSVRGTTPFLEVDVDGETFDGCTVVVTLDQDGNQITKTNNGTDVKVTKVYDEETGEAIGSIVAVYLSQRDTLQFDVGKVRGQIKWIDVLGEVDSTVIFSVDIDEALLEREIRYGE